MVEPRSISFETSSTARAQPSPLGPLPSQRRLAGHPGDGPQPRSLDGAARSGRAGGDHQDAPAAVLLPRRTPHPPGTSPHPASAPALALGKPVQWRLGPIASPATPSLTAGLQLTQRPRQLAPGRPTSVSCCMPPWQSRPAPPLRATIVVSVWLSHAVLIPIYWNRAWIVRLPLPISPCVNASTPPFGGSG